MDKQTYAQITKGRPQIVRLQATNKNYLTKLAESLTAAQVERQASYAEIGCVVKEAAQTSNKHKHMNIEP